MELLKGKLPKRRREVPRNALTNHLAFRGLEDALRLRSLQAGSAMGLHFSNKDAKQFGLKHPERVAVEALRRIIRNEKLPYTADKYRVEDGSWIVRVRGARASQKRGRKGPEEGHMKAGAA